MNFDELTRAIADASVLAKSLSAPASGDDKKIAAAAADGEAAGGAKGPEDDDDDDDEGGTDGDADGDDEANEGDDEEGTKARARPMVKSFKLQLEDGSEMEAFDGTEMVKALTERIDADNEKFLKSFGSALELVTQLTKALTETRGDLASTKEDVKSQKETIETLQKSLKSLGAQGRGRMSTVSVLEKPTGKPVEKPAPTRQEIMSKAMSALSAKRITGSEATRLEAALNAGVSPQKDVLERIFSA